MDYDPLSMDERPSAAPETFTLPDGRVLAYASYGAGAAPSKAAAVATFFYFHGFPASRLEGALWHDAAFRLNIRLIAPDRPGMGLSAFQPSRTLLDWPADVLALADHLQIARFGVLGLSGGAPYVFACAKELPAARLRAAAVVSGLYPVSLGTTGMMWQGRALLWVAPRMSGAVAALLDRGLGVAARDSDHPDRFDEILQREIRNRPEADRRCIEGDERFRRRFIDSVRESFRTGSRGAAWEGKLFGSPWGFDLAEVNSERTTLWHGGLDVNSPIAMARKAAALLPGAVLEEVAAEGHVSLVVSRMEEVLRRLVDGAR
jgi:pimeloyl-ACP methyl ester carboxylesterase